MKIINYIAQASFLVLILSFYGCEDNLDLESEDKITTEVVLSDPANVKKVLVGIYDEAGQVASYGGRLNIASELLANAGALSWNGTFSNLAEMDRKQVTTTNTFVRNFWLNAYEVNNQANIVLANIETIENATERATIEGEAKFLRALVYFDLVRFFAQSYDATTPNTQLGVPIITEAVLSTDQITFPTRATVVTVYEQVINDLKEAYALLPDSNGIFADKYTAQALLARVYLQQQNYPAARDAANDVLANSGHALTASYEAAFNNDENATEDIFAWQITSQDGRNNMNTFWASSDFGGRSGNPDIEINDSYLTIFDDVNDDRGSFFYISTRGRRATTKWQSQFANIPFLRIAEMHLIRAEANFRETTTIGLAPLAELNALRARANAAPLTALTLQDIIDERKRELAFEGFALHDIKRLKGTAGALPYNDNFLVLPIPQRERDANPELDQNPGYSN